MKNLTDQSRQVVMPTPPDASDAAQKKIDPDVREAAIRQQAERLDAARQEKARQERELQKAARAEQEARRDVVSSSTARRGRLFGRTDPNTELILYAEAWS
jgi:hypothetical protein